MDRRNFHKFCGGLLTGAAALYTSAGQAAQPYPASRLVFEDDTYVTLDSLETGKAFIFSYPYKTTPCFLVRLAKSAPGFGSWPGGMDIDQSVVAFSAICSHKMTHPAKPISHIAFRADPIDFYDATGRRRTQTGVISCCSERSVYDPADGGKVLSGPAPYPLAAIALTSDEQGRLTAIGSIGADRYEQFLEKFGFRLAMEYGVPDVRTRSGDKSTTIPADTFSRQLVLC